ncbi:AbrB/MazE/SpoVT family DNA-binding domain-containing protein [Hungatella effluvii]|uniref:AbrB/MazE/SpoVT family DNA-binding domain-containing protein n=1 Tax=Hungatella effluvii TaxID=1096246 RepID=UPI0022E972A8|nr:AbrB/MazE/SpoVT family DNA-binding domain-containing protein [Hungatella effluvii]
MSKTVYKLMDYRGRVMIPKEMREAMGVEYGSIIALNLSNGQVVVRKIELIEVGDQSPEVVEAYVRAAIKTMPDTIRLSLISDLFGLIQQKGE